MARSRSTSRRASAGGGKTANLLLRGIDRKLVDVFKARADRHGRSLQSELQLSLSRAAHRNFDEALRVSEQWHAKFSGRAFSAAKTMINEDRRR